MKCHGDTRDGVITRGEERPNWGRTTGDGAGMRPRGDAGRRKSRWAPGHGERGSRAGAADLGGRPPRVAV